MCNKFDPYDIPVQAQSTLGEWTNMSKKKKIEIDVYIINQPCEETIKRLAAEILRQTKESLMSKAS
jgi:hypothetical protein